MGTISHHHLLRSGTLIWGSVGFQSLATQRVCYWWAGDFADSTSCFDAFSPSLRFVVMSDWSCSFFYGVATFKPVRVGFWFARNMILRWSWLTRAKSFSLSFRVYPVLTGWKFLDSQRYEMGFCLLCERCLVCICSMVLAFVLFMFHHPDD
jgi:hypothetical protein